MKFKLTGLSQITLRGVTFQKGKPQTVENEDLAEKLRSLDYFEEVKRGRKGANDKNST